MENSVRTIVMLVAVLTAFHAAPSANGQCPNGQCAGRCTYGVVGSCVPKTKTFGHYETTWRPWREPAPAVPKRMKSMSEAGKGNIQLDLPEAGDESDSDPEFSHLKNSSDLNPTPMPSSGYSMPESYSTTDDLSTDRPIESSVPPSVSIDQGVPPGPPSDGGAVDLPSAEVEGESSGGVGDLLDGPSPILNFESRMRRNPARSVAVVSHQAVDSAGNPLRRIVSTKPIRSFKASANTASFKSPLRSVPLGNVKQTVNRARNPLR